jgi:hypothetical protein
MDPVTNTETLLTIAQVAITLIGFSGIVVVIGERAITKWTPEEWLRFYALIVPTLTAFFCSFVPILVGMLSGEPDVVWRVSNAVLGLAHLANFAVFLMNPKKAEITLGQRLNGVVGAATIAAHFLAAAAIVPWYIPIFVFGLLQQMWVGIHNFLLLFKPTASEVG